MLLTHARPNNLHSEALGKVQDIFQRAHALLQTMRNFCSSKVLLSVSLILRNYLEKCHSPTFPPVPESTSIITLGSHLPLSEQNVSGKTRQKSHQMQLRTSDPPRYTLAKVDNQRCQKKPCLPQRDQVSGPELPGSYCNCRRIRYGEPC